MPGSIFYLSSKFGTSTMQLSLAKTLKLMLSEYEQNLRKEKESPVSKKGRRWSLVRQQSTAQEENLMEYKKLSMFAAGLGMADFLITIKYQYHF